MISIFRISLFFLLIRLFVPEEINAQTCAEIKILAEGLEKDRAREVAQYEALMANIKEKRRMILDLGGSPAGFAGLPAFNERALTYFDDRKRFATCPEWGKINWGLRKDIREYNYDKHSLYNPVLRQEIDRLDAILSDLVNNQRPDQPALGFSAESAAPAPRTIQAGDRTTFAGKTYRYCLFNPLLADVRIAHRHAYNIPQGFDILANQVKTEAKTLILAMNAGMFEANKQPVGLLVSGGKELSPLNQRKGRGNFYMQPNGVFGIDNTGAAFILSTRAFANRKMESSQLKLATQSGPVLLLNGKINQKFNPNSSNLHFRNAVGIRDDGMVIFAISEQKVSFYEFSRFLLSRGCTRALYLDGTVSRMYLPFLNKQQDFYDSQHLGPLLYIVE